MPVNPSKLFARPFAAPLAVAVVAVVAVLCELDAAGDYPSLAEGPGVTIDEVFNVQQGVRLVVGGEAWLVGAFTLRDLFGDERELGPNPAAGYHLPDHPPLGRLWLGVCHQTFVWLFPPREHEGPFVTTAARSGSALAFALTVFLIGWCGARWYGKSAGLIAAVSLVLMPRVFGHAHLAALETCIGLAYAGCVLYLAERWSGVDPPRLRHAAIAGVLLGLALLTKIQAVLLPVPVVLWALWRWRQRAFVPCLVWGVTGAAVLFLGWPWLWLHPWDHLLEYLGRTTHRAALHVWYFGRQYADRDVPWHYPWVMFAATVPIGLQALGVVGLLRRVEGEGDRLSAGSRPPVPPLPKGGSSMGPQSPLTKGGSRIRCDLNAREWLLLGCLASPLVVFSLPGVAVYDGERLFLVSFPLWALFIGRGGAAAIEWIGNRLGGRASESKRQLVGRFTIGLLVAVQGYGLATVRPCYLSYYNAAVGGLPGAERLGLELTYWGDSITRSLLRDAAAAVPDGARVGVAPVLHQFQLAEMKTQSPILRRSHIELTALDRASREEWLLDFRRRADLVEPWPAGTDVEPLAEVRRQGVTLAGLYRVRGGSP